MMIKRFSKGHTKIGHINCIFDNGEETDMTLHDNDDNLNPYDETGKTSIEKIIDQMNHLEDAKIKVIKDNNRLKNKITQLETQIDHLKWENEQLKYDNFMFKGVIETFQKVAISERKKLEKENEQLKIANAKWLDKSLQDKQIRYNNSDHNELVHKYLQLKEETEQLQQIMKDIVVATDETYAKNMSMFKVTVVLDYEKYREIKECLYE